MVKKIYLLLLISLLISSNIKSQSIYEFLRVNTSPRSLALAGNLIAGDNDPDIAFYNPAGIVLLSDDTPISFSFLKYLEDINAASIVAAYKYEDAGYFSAGIKYMNYGSFTETDDVGNILGDFGVNDMALHVGYANFLEENFMYGVNAKFIYSNIGGYSSTAIAADLGLHYTIPENNWNFGFSILNVGTQTSSYFSVKEDLPLDIRIGASKQLERLPLRIYLSFIKLNDNNVTFFRRFRNIIFGGELKISEVVKLRLGYNAMDRKDLKTGSTSGLAGFNFGIGFNVEKYIFGYSISSLGSVGWLHSLGISTSLKGE